MKLVVLLILGATLLEANTLEEFQSKFNDLGADIAQQVQELRASNSDAILAMNQKMLRKLGNYTIAAREVLIDKNITIQVEEWLNNDPNAQGCFDWAYVLVDLYGWFITWDIGQCAVYTAEEINAESQYHFFSHAHYILRAGTEGYGRVLESHGLHRTEEVRLEFVEEQFDWLSYLWANYQNVLKQEIEGHETTGDWIAAELHECLERVLEDVDFYIQFISGELEYCLANLDIEDK